MTRGRNTDHSAAPGRHRRARRLLLCLVLGAAVAAGSCGDREAPEEIVVGLIAPLTSSAPARDGAVLAADEINAGGGIAIDGARRRLRLVVEDSEEGPESAVSGALKLINRDRAVALVGLPRSYSAIPVARLAEQYGVPLVSTMSTHPETTAGKRYVFRMAFLNALQGKALADFAFDDLGARRVAALVQAASTYSVDLGEVFGREIQQRGAELVAHETFTEDRMEVTRQLGRIKESGADLLFLPNFSRMVAEHARAARGSGITATFLGGDSWGIGLDLYSEPAIRGSYFSDFWAPDQAGEATRSFIAEYERRFGATPTAIAALSYDAISLVAEALRRGGADREGLRASLAGLEDFHGVSGTVGFSGSGDPARSIFIRKVEEDGQIRLYREIAP